MKIRNKINDIKRCSMLLEQLEDDYLSKKKGEIYLKRKSYLNNKIKNNIEKLLRAGKGEIKLYRILVRQLGIKSQFKIYMSSQFTSSDIKTILEIKLHRYEVLDVTVEDFIVTGELIQEPINLK